MTRDDLEKEALRLLSRRETTTQNLRRALRRRAAKGGGDVPELDAWIDEILKECESRGYLSDARYAAQRVRTMRRQGSSRRKIETALRGKGIGSETIRRLMDDEGDGAEDQAARRTVERRRLGLDASRFDKELASLARAGFGYDVARRALYARRDAPSDEYADASENNTNDE